MRVCVHACVCVYVCMHVCMHVCMGYNYTVCLYIGRAFNRLMKDTFKEKQIEVRLYNIQVLSGKSIPIVSVHYV